MSNSATIKYQPLSQTAPSDDDDEDEGFDDNILYDSRLVIGPVMNERNVFELERLGQPRVRSPVIIQGLGRGRRIVVLVAVLLVIMLGVVVAILFPILNHKYNHGIVTDVPTEKSGRDWIKVFNRTWTESSVTLLDIDGDGLDDVLIGLATESRATKSVTSHTGPSINREGLHSGAHIVAFRGYDGHELWWSPTRSLVLNQNCLDIDVNNDETIDCIVTGHDSTCQAIDVKTGKMLWAVDPESPHWSPHFIPGWSVYGVIMLSDLDSDGVQELLVSHGDIKDQQVQKQDQRPGRLIILAGRTGEVIGSLELPEGESIFMPPVKYMTSEKALYILYGSGGMNSQGKLFAVSQPDLYHSITGKTLTHLDLSIYTWLEEKTKDKNGMVELFRNSGNDDILAPVLLDTDADGHDDLLVASHDGSLALLDGKSLQEKWRKSFGGMEINSPLVPGKFSSDSVIDFMIELTKASSGNISQILIISGTDGETLWSVQAGNYTLSPGLSLKTDDGSSVFLVRVANAATRHLCLQPLLDSQMPGKETRENDNQPQLSSVEFQNLCTDMMQKVAGTFVTCDHDLEAVMEQVVLLDQRIDDQPLKLLQQTALRFHYKLQHKPGSQHCHNVTGVNSDEIDLCTVLVPVSYAGAVGDTDADDSLDYIHVSQMLGLNRSDSLNVTGPISSVVLSKHSISSAVTKGDYLHINIDAVGHSRRISPQQHAQSWKFLPSESQPWTQFQFFGRLQHALFHYYMNS